MQAKRSPAPKSPEDDGEQEEVITGELDIEKHCEGGAAAGPPRPPSIIPNPSPGIASGIRPEVGVPQGARPAPQGPPSAKAPEPAPEPKKTTFDIFSDSPPPAAAHATAAAAAQHDGDNMALADNWDDAEGYYAFRLGDVLGGRFRVFATTGRGVFSSVFRARDLQDNEREVAIKVIRSNETMYKAGVKEREILQLLGSTDPEGKKHVIRMVSHFEHKNHLCLVFESMALNLREVLDKFGRKVGLNIHAVKVYARQLLIALKHLHKHKIIHADLKPDNILVTEDKKVMKLCDFGSAMYYPTDVEPTPYLVSRFYRAPEIIVGIAYDFAADMWSVGCCLFELYTGRIAFPGKTNNEMLKHFQDLKGKLPHRMIRRGKREIRELHFDEDLNFLYQDTDSFTNQPIVRKLGVVKTTRDLQTMLVPAGTKLDADESQKVSQLRDLLDKVFTLDPAKRISIDDALHHPFVKTN